MQKIECKICVTMDELMKKNDDSKFDKKNEFIPTHSNDSVWIKIIKLLSPKKINILSDATYLDTHFRYFY